MFPSWWHLVQCMKHVGDLCGFINMHVVRERLVEAVWKLTCLLERLRPFLKTGFSSDQSSTSLSSMSCSLWPSICPSGSVLFAEHPGKHTHAHKRKREKRHFISLGMDGWISVQRSGGELKIKLEEERGGKRRVKVAEWEGREGWGCLKGGTTQFE